MRVRWQRGKGAINLLTWQSLSPQMTSSCLVRAELEPREHNYCFLTRKEDIYDQTGLSSAHRHYFQGSFCLSIWCWNSFLHQRHTADSYFFLSCVQSSLYSRKTESWVLKQRGYKTGDTSNQSSNAETRGSVKLPEAPRRSRLHQRRQR